jgi:hypothetical protein
VVSIEPEPDVVRPVESAVMVMMNSAFAEEAIAATANNAPTKANAEDLRSNIFSLLEDRTTETKR